MQWSRVKSILIVILLLVDGFLLLNVAGKYFSRSYRAAENAHNITEILTARGIETGKSFALPEAGALPVLQVDRSRSDEDAFSTGLLGEDAVREDKPDGATSYVSTVGTLTWSGGGEVAGAFLPSDYVLPDAAREMEHLTQTLLQEAGVTSPVLLEINETEAAVSVHFTTAGVPVFNRALTFRFAPDKIVLSGWWTFGMPYTTKSGSYVTCAAADAIFTLIAKNTVARIDELESGFLLTENGGGRVQMTPGWRIETDSGSFFVDSLKKSSILIEKN